MREICLEVFAVCGHMASEPPFLRGKRTPVLMTLTKTGSPTVNTSPTSSILCVDICERCRRPAVTAPFKTNADDGPSKYSTFRPVARTLLIESLHFHKGAVVLDGFDLWGRGERGRSESEAVHISHRRGEIGDHSQIVSSVALIASGSHRPG
jgi:hypothetical protein